MSLGGMLFSEGRERVMDLGSRRETGERGGRENCGWDEIYERRTKNVHLI